MANPLALEMHRFEFSFPASAEPAWSKKVDRWYQLDASAYGVTEGFYQLQDKLGAYPSLMILASPAGSGETDRQFAKGGAASPARFVHTLPSVRSSSLCQVMEWSGQILCLQKNPETVEVGLSEAALWAWAHPGCKPVWVVSVFRLQESLYRVDWFVVSDKRGVAPSFNDGYLKCLPGGIGMLQDQSGNWELRKNHE